MGKTIAATTAFCKPLASPSAVGSVGCTTCGSRIEVQIKVEDGKITDAGFDSSGCEYCRECACIAAQQIVGKTIDEAAVLSDADIEPHLKEVRDDLDGLGYAVACVKLAVRHYEVATGLRKAS